MANRQHSQAVRKRFVQAMEQVIKDRYPVKISDITEKIGLTHTNYNRLKNSENNYPTLDNCVELCLQFGISATWLLLGVGTMKETRMSKKKKPIDLLKDAVAEIEEELKKRRENE